MKGSALIFLLFASLTCRANGAPDWYTGVIVLKNDQVLTGEISIQSSLNVVLLKTANEAKYYPADVIRHAYVNDGLSKLPRKFEAHPSVHTQFGRYQMYEVVVDGNIQVLRKPKGNMLPELENSFAYDYYLRYQDVTMDISDFARKIYPVIQEEYRQLSLNEMPDQSSFDLTKTDDVIRFIRSFNEQATLHQPTISFNN